MQKIILPTYKHYVHCTYLVLDACCNKVDEIDDNVHDNVEVGNNFEDNFDNMMMVADDNCISYYSERTQ